MEEESEDSEERQKYGDNTLHVCSIITIGCRADNSSVCLYVVCLYIRLDVAYK